MERYNDALALASGTTPPGSETTHQSVQGQGWPRLVHESVLPAIAFKLETVEKMVESHRELGRPVAPELAATYDAYTNWLGAMRRRAEAQQAEWKKWLTDPTMEAVDTVQLDREELAAGDAASISLHGVILKRLKMLPATFMEMGARATNSVREMIGLAPLSEAEYTNKYMLGISGMPVRLYS
jgi:hypothetical protein